MKRIPWFLLAVAIGAGLGIIARTETSRLSDNFTDGFLVGKHIEAVGCRLLEREGVRQYGCKEVVTRLLLVNFEQPKPRYRWIDAPADMMLSEPWSYCDIESMVCVPPNKANL